MPDVKNAAYVGNTGTITVDGDRHFGVTSCALVPNSTDEQVPDISGDVQSFVSEPLWRLQLEFHQDHKTSGALVRESIGWHGQLKEVTYVPQAGGDSITVEVTWKAANIGGGTGRHSSTLDLPVSGELDITPAVIG